MRYIFGIFVFFWSLIAHAIDLPLSFQNAEKMPHPSAGAMPHMYGYVVGFLGVDHKGSIAVKFSNGNRTVGGHFRVTVQFVDSFGNSVAAYRYDKLIGMAGFHGAVERQHNIPISIAKGSVEKIQRVQVMFCIDGIGDINGSSGLSKADREQWCPG